MNKTRWIIFAVIIVGIFAALIITNQKSEVAFTGDATKVITERPIPDHVYGTDKQKVVLIEYGDFQCPGCGAMYPTVKTIKETYKNELTFIFRNMPLTNIHPNALASATVAEAAGKQNKFFDMFDQLYANQDAWSGASTDKRGGIFEGYARAIGLNIDQFKNDLGSADITQKIKRDQATAKTFNVTSTPSFILNGQKLPEAAATNPDELQKAIKNALQQAGLLKS